MDVMEPSSRRHTADLAGASKHWGLSEGVRSRQHGGDREVQRLVGRQFVVREDKSALPSRFLSQEKVDHAFRE
jgi:hypothetical protein